MLKTFLVALLLSAVSSSGAYTSTEVTVTAYNSVPEQTDDTPLIGACNKRLPDLVHPIAVSRDLFAEGLVCGKKVRIVGDATQYVVMDKMAARHRRHIDIFMGMNVPRARAFGVHRARIRWREEPARGRGFGPA